MALGGLAIVIYAAKGGPVLALAGIALGLFLVFGALDDLVDRATRGGRGQVFNRLRGIPQSIVAMTLAHAGAGLMVIGISATAFETEKILAMKPGETVTLDGYSLSLEGIGPIAGRITTRLPRASPCGIPPRGAGHVATGQAGLYRPPDADLGSGAFRHGLSEIYLAIGETSDGQHVDLRAYHKPYVLLIWLGPLLMSIGGLLSLFDRRLRIGVPARRARMTPQPAE